MTDPFIVRGQTAVTAYHTDRDCHRINEDTTTRTATEAEQEKLHECQICQGDTYTGGSQYSTGHLQSLKAAAAERQEQGEGAD